MRSWRPRKASIQVLYQTRSKNQGADGVSASLRPRAQDPGALMSEGMRREVPVPEERENPFLLYIFCSVWALNGLNAL
jgi:hypothetical protein